MTEANAPRSPDIVDRILGALDHLLDTVHDRVLRPVIMTARFIAYGFVLVVLGVVLLSVLVIGLVRVLDVYAFAGKDWITYALVGTVSLITGLVIWRRRRPVRP